MERDGARRAGDAWPTGPALGPPGAAAPLARAATRPGLRRTHCRLEGGPTLRCGRHALIEGERLDEVVLERRAERAADHVAVVGVEVEPLVGRDHRTVALVTLEHTTGADRVRLVLASGATLPVVSIKHIGQSTAVKKGKCFMKPGLHNVNHKRHQ